jgi:serine/threonine protein kinase
VIHRDLKPGNILIGDFGETVVIDWGLAKDLDADDSVESGARFQRPAVKRNSTPSNIPGSSTLTVAGAVMGTPAYMAPEQARGLEVDHRADVYSLAAILYRVVTGHPAFTGKDVPSTLYEVVYRVPTQPSILAQVPADVDRVLAIGLAKDPADRFATALELAAWVDRVIDRGLDPEQRRRADELILRQPWGTRLGGS